ncbi:MAG: lamin tail domain-containing protein, partial [Nocardioides sp.]
MVTSFMAFVQSAEAATTNVVINEIMYNPPSGLDGDEFLELANPGSVSQDLSGWCFTSGVTLCMPAGSSIAAHGYVVVGEDAVEFQKAYGFSPAAVYTGKLSNSGETVTLTDGGGVVADSVTYGESDPWPTKPDGTGPSLELIDPTLDHNDPLNWAASTASSGNTIRAANSVARSTGLTPRITGVSASPQQPAANQAVSVSATITGLTGATIFYRTDFGAEQSKPMTSGGGDSFTASLPGVPAGHLLRYRIQATNAAGTGRFPRVDDTITYQGVVAADGITSAIPELQWFISDADYNQITQNPTQSIDKPAVLAYNGVVYDNVTAGIHGNVSRTAPKPNWQFVMPKDHDIDLPGLATPVDNFLMQSEWADHSHGRSQLSWETYRESGSVDTQAFPIRTQRNGSFQGLYTYQDQFDGTWRDRQGLSDAQFFKADHSVWDENKLLTTRFEKKNPGDSDFTPLRAFMNGVESSGTAQRNYLLGNADIPEMINYAAATAIMQSSDAAAHNFFFAQDPTTARWSIIPWDLDKTWGHTCCGVNSTFVTPDEPGDPTNNLMHAILSQPDWRQMYFRRLQTLVGHVLAPGALESYYDTHVGPAEATAALDMNAWPTKPWMAWDRQRTALFTAIQSRRSVFASDPRMPGAQSANPNIVINEIQHSPTGGNDAEFLELYNPSATEAVDLSGWRIADAVDLTVQPGTVILPHGFMVFSSNDPVFRTTYGSTIFSGGSYGGHLSSGETITLTRADGSVDDTVAYGGTGWPQPTSGQSLELLNPGSDNSDPANWALSVAPGGTPGSANQQTSTITAPGAPTIGTASAGDGTATPTWTAPGDDGGSPITGYQVRVVDAATQQQVGGLLPAGASATSLLVNGLTNGTAYQFQVAAVNVKGAGAMSVLSNAVVPQASQMAFVAAVHSGDGAGRKKTLTVPVAASPGDTMVLFFTRKTAVSWSGPTGVTGWTQISTGTQNPISTTMWVK